MSLFPGSNGNEMIVLVVDDGEYVEQGPFGDSDYEKTVDAVWDDPVENQKFMESCQRSRGELVARVAAQIGSTASTTKSNFL